MSEEKITLKDAVKNHYESKVLSEHQLERLKTRRPRLDLKVVLTGTITACLLFFFYFNTKPLSQRVMNEIAYNHNKNLGVEFNASEYGELQTKLPKLDFLIAQSNKLAPAKWKLLGARYCSIQGKIAAQIKLRNTETGEDHTLYQAKIPNGLSSNAISSDIDGVTVRMWTEKGLLFGIAGPN